MCNIYQYVVLFKGFRRFKETKFIKTNNIVLSVSILHNSPNLPSAAAIRTTHRFQQLVLKKYEKPLQVLNGRAALCAGRDDMSDDEDDDGGGDNGNDRSMQGGSRKQRVTQSQQHRFAKPDNFKTVLESGAIPDAAMIHAARKRRQKAREDGEFVPLEDKPPATASNPATVSTATAPSAAKGGSKSRLVREDGDDDDGSDEERVDMSAINGAREREERREKFYSVQQECEYSVLTVCVRTAG